jgi:hypothetical protein
VDSIVRSAAARNFDVAVNRTFPFVGDVTGKFSVEVFNLLNRAQFGPPNSNLDDPAFGTVTKQANLARTLQFALRLSF